MILSIRRVLIRMRKVARVTRPMRLRTSDMTAIRVLARSVPISGMIAIPRMRGSAMGTDVLVGTLDGINAVVRAGH